MELVYADLLKAELTLKTESFSSLCGKAHRSKSSIFLSFPMVLPHQEIRFLTTAYVKYHRIKELQKGFALQN